MPIIYEKQLNEDCKLAVWHITETQAELESQLWIADKSELANIKVPEKQLQWLAVRVLLQALLNVPESSHVLFKDEYGKPVLINDTHHCSLSHSGLHVATIIHTKSAVGIDIQHLHPRILSIANKFVNETEQIAINTNDAILQTHVIWGAKESLFKLYGKGNVDFKKNLTVMPFEISSQGRTTAYIDLPDYQALCQIHYTHTSDYVLVAGVLE